jgi:hypothetical protein
MDVDFTLFPSLLWFVPGETQTMHLMIVRDIVDYLITSLVLSAKQYCKGIELVYIMNVHSVIHI